MAQEKINLPYKETPYTITARRKFYHEETKTVSINPSTPNPTIEFNLIRKTGVWNSHSWTEPELFTVQTINDVNVRPENSFIQTTGVNGVRTYSEEREFIDDEWTGEWRNRTSSVTTEPVTQVYINGTAIIEWRNAQRTEVVPYTSSTYQSNLYYEDETVVTTVGKNGVRTYTWQNEYMNNVATGNERNHANSITTAPINERIAIGTKKRNYITTEPIQGQWPHLFYYPWLHTIDPSKEYLVVSTNGYRIYPVNSNGQHVNNPIISGSTVPGSQLIPENYTAGLVAMMFAGQLQYEDTTRAYTISVTEVN